MMRFLAVSLVAVCLSLPAFADLKIQDVKATYGPNGPARDSLTTFAGDTMFFSYTVTGIKADDNGGIKVRIRNQLKNSDGKVLLSEQQPAQGFLALGGSEMAGYASVTFGLDYPPGEYTVAVTVTDEVANQTMSFERKVELQKPDFAMINVRFFLDADSKVAAAGTLARTERLYIRFSAIGFDRSANKLDLTMFIQTLDEKGTELIPKPIRAEVKSDQPEQVAKITAANFSGNLVLNRAGAYRIHIMVEDAVNKKKLDVVVPIKVVD
nr:hypothetical protein [Gemmataceae bacterium]